ncbi:MAG: aminodeoxychorismate/anthranilate synthase component II [Chlorobi bacterium]|nr:aminodeoxychorismate/anthranilate synthase component II [Chlorobiota bacterium]
MKKILVIDNYDSFTYNLVYYISEITGHQPEVFRNDRISLKAVSAFDKIVISPGPGIPSEAGICPELIEKYAPVKSILGICLGHQAIAEVFGGTLENLKEVYHGISTGIRVLDQEESLFDGLSPVITGGRYHSWIVRKEGFPGQLRITCEDEKGIIMGIRHKSLDVRGLQFHPESVLTPDGMIMMKNWLKT